MESQILLNYNITINKIITEKSFWVIRNETETFYFVPYLRDFKDIKKLHDITLELLNKNIATHTFVMNKKNNLITNINSENYVLIKINFPEEKEFNLRDIHNMSNLTDLAVGVHRNDWAKLWSEKIDYFEYQIKEMGSNKQIILNTFGYYVGLAENAISYVNFIEKNMIGNTKVVLCRRRIFFPNYAINYLNPLTFYFDLEVRDIAEYIKASFFNDNDVWEEIEPLFKDLNLSPYECHMFYARLLYPSYYFDIYEQIMNKGVDEDELIPIIRKCNNYEEFLRTMYSYLNNFTSMIPIDWLNKKIEF